MPGHYLGWFTFLLLCFVLFACCDVISDTFHDCFDPTFYPLTS